MVGWVHAAGQASPAGPSVVVESWLLQVRAAFPFGCIGEGYGCHEVEELKSERRGTVGLRLCPRGF